MEKRISHNLLSGVILQVYKAKNTNIDNLLIFISNFLSRLFEDAPDGLRPAEITERIGRKCMDLLKELTARGLIIKKKLEKSPTTI